MNKMLYAASAVAVTAAVTALLRFLPFLLFRGKRKTPAAVTYLGNVLPYGVMAMLVVFCLRGTTLSAPAGWVPQAAACTVTALLHAWKHNTLLSIVCGTACYMILVQSVFV